jgi:hypothetical protein
MYDLTHSLEICKILIIVSRHELREERCGMRGLPRKTDMEER